MVDLWNARTIKRCNVFFLLLAVILQVDGMSEIGNNIYSFLSICVAIRCSTPMPLQGELIGYKRFQCEIVYQFYHIFFVYVSFVNFSFLFYAFRRFGAGSPVPITIGEMDLEVAATVFV